jgi:hypothetical protein
MSWKICTPNGCNLDGSAVGRIGVGAVDTRNVSPAVYDAFTTEMASSVNNVGENPIPGADPRNCPAVSWSDAVAMSRIISLFDKHNKEFSSKNVTVADLRDGPAV